MLTFERLAESYNERHVVAKKLAIGDTIVPASTLLERFGDRPITDIRTADIEDFIADLRNTKSRRNRSSRQHPLTARSSCCDTS